MGLRGPAITLGKWPSRGEICLNEARDATASRLWDRAGGELRNVINYSVCDLLVLSRGQSLLQDPRCIPHDLMLGICTARVQLNLSLAPRPSLDELSSMRVGAPLCCIAGLAIVSFSFGPKDAINL